MIGIAERKHNNSLMIQFFFFLSAFVFEATVDDARSEFVLKKC